jgi:uncharacterized protein
MNREKDFYYAVVQNQAEELMKLMQEDPNFCRDVTPYNESLLYHAAVNGHQGIVDLLLSRGCEANVQNPDGYTPLHAAALHGFVPVMISLIKNKGKIDTEDKYGNTPLIEAVQHFNGDMGPIALLIENGANPGHENKYGVSPFSLALQSKQERIVQYFKTSGFTTN